MKVLFDTHALAWWLLKDDRLPITIYDLVADPDNQVWVSAVSAFEMATKFRIGKWPGIGQLVQDFETAIEQENFDLLPVNSRHAARGGMLEGEHRDPFDRLLAGQSLAEAIPLITGDPAFRAFGVETVW